MLTCSLWYNNPTAVHIHEAVHIETQEQLSKTFFSYWDHQRFRADGLSYYSEAWVYLSGASITRFVCFHFSGMTDLENSK